jgi:uncharacterized protein
MSETEPLASVLWHDREGLGAERCRLHETDSGFLVVGVAVFANAGLPAIGRYEVVVDRAWRTRKVWAEIDDGRTIREIELEADGLGRWRLAGADADVGDGCIDVDLNFSPSTNTLPIRRLELEIGASATIRALWLRLSDLSLEAVEQCYERISENRWQYSSGAFRAEIVTGAQRLISDYEGIWRAIAWGASSREARAEVVHETDLTRSSTAGLPPTVLGLTRASRRPSNRTSAASQSALRPTPSAQTRTSPAPPRSP